MRLCGRAWARRARRLNIRAQPVDSLSSGPRARVLGDAPECPYSILPGDLLAFLVSSAGVGDANLIDPTAEASDLGDDLRLEAEAGLLDRDLLDHLPPERLVAALHVREVQIGGQVREESQEFVTDGVPEVEHTVFSTSQEPGAEYDIGLAVNYGPNELAIVVGVVLKVGILYKDDIPGGLSESRPEGCSLTTVALVEEAHDPVAAEGMEKVGSAVRRAVVHDDKILLEPRRRRHPNSIEHIGDRLTLVVHGDHNR